MKGNGNQQDYGMRIYDPRVGRFLSVDPLTRAYPMLTPYQFASNRPIDGVDLDGKEWSKIETYDPKTGVTNIHFQVKLAVTNDSELFNDKDNLKAALSTQFSTAFKGITSGDSKVTYSASLDVIFDDVGAFNFGVVIGDAYEPEPGFQQPAGASTNLNTQANGITVKATNWDKSSNGLSLKSTNLIAQDIVHELFHTAMTYHPQDNENTAADVDLVPAFETLPSGETKFKTYKLGPKATLERVVSNIFIYGQVPIGEKRVSEYEPDPSKRNKVSPDQAKIITEQVEKDTKQK